MRQYGFNKATEFTSKQINVIWGKSKSGLLKVEKWFIKELYNLADYYGADSNRIVEDREHDVLRILEEVFADNLKKAQELINDMTERMYQSFGLKYQKLCNRSEFVA